MSRLETTPPIAFASISDLERYVADSFVRRPRLSDIEAVTNEPRTGWNLPALVSKNPEERYANPMLDEEYSRLVAPLAEVAGNATEPVGESPKSG